MKKAPIPKNEKERLSDLRSYNILDSGPETAFDDITRLASWITGKPIALISLLDSERQWFKSKVGLEASETPRDISFCGHAIDDSQPFIIPDATKDPRFADNPIVTGAPYVIFYAGIPLESTAGYKLGTLCVVDSKPGTLTADQTEMMRCLARQVIGQMELRKKSGQLEKAISEKDVLNKSLHRANMAKSDFIANMSHEIRTPLNAISGTLQILDEQCQIPADKQILSMAMGASETVLQLVNNILDLAKIESGRMEINLEPTDIIQATRMSAEMFTSRARLNDIKIKTTIDTPAHAVFLSDELRIKQILMNLVGNSLKFTKPGGTIDISLRITPHERDTLATWTISDNGIGIAPAALEKLGRPFEQGDKKIQHQFGGTGLGLSLVKQLVTLLNGSVNITSTLGQGTQVTVSLPMQVSTLDATQTDETEASGPLNPCPTLVVDDARTNRVILRRFIEPWDFKVLEAASGPEALDIFREKSPPLVLLDIQMPEMDGYEVVKRIRAMEASNPGKPKAYIIAVTGQAYDDDVHKCLTSGFDAHLPKPVLKAKLRQLLRNRPT